MKLDIFLAQYTEANLVKVILVELKAQEFPEAVEVMLGSLMAELLGDPGLQLLGVDASEFLTSLHLGSPPPTQPTEMQATPEETQSNSFTESKP